MTKFNLSDKRVQYPEIVTDGFTTSAVRKFIKMLKEELNDYETTHTIGEGEEVPSIAGIINKCAGAMFK